MAWFNFKKKLTCFALCAVLALFGFGKAHAETQERAKVMLIEALSKIGKAKQIKFTVFVSEERIFKNLETLNFFYKYSVELAEEDKVVLDLPRVNGVSRIFYNEGNFSYLDVTRSLYKTEKIDLDDKDIFSVLREKYQLTLPGVDLVTKHFRDDMERWAKHSSYIGLERLQSGPAHHLAYFSDPIDWQVWVDRKSKLPVYMIVTYNQIEGEPQTHMKFSEWKISSVLKSDLFEFSPPKGAKSFSSQVLTSTESEAEEGGL
ncbi:DUF2092 domain-containing protein [Flexibacterium corallicola]|uniref:DUF2092 domain-containing protein n=1 Tax=Flexibacterium corallicola TaxID=3037259 RepID=UPI00286FAEEA|nr:DUF2092 domain-containing protein [Pseudovibrio sp. M1P-2-3]